MENKSRQLKTYCEAYTGFVDAEGRESGMLRRKSPRTDGWLLWRQMGACCGRLCQEIVTVKVEASTISAALGNRVQGGSWSFFSSFVSPLAACGDSSRPRLQACVRRVVSVSCSWYVGSMILGWLGCVASPFGNSHFNDAPEELTLPSCRYLCVSVDHSRALLKGTTAYSCACELKGATDVDVLGARV